MIVRTGPRKFELRSRSTGRVLGTHPSYDAALRQERAIKASQARAARNPSEIPPWSEWPTAGRDESRGVTIDGERYYISPMYKISTGRRSKKKPVEYDWIAMTLVMHPRSMSASKIARYIHADGYLQDDVVRFDTPSEAVNAVRARHAKVTSK